MTNRRGDGGSDHRLTENPGDFAATLRLQRDGGGPSQGSSESGDDETSVVTRGPVSIRGGGVQSGDLSPTWVSVSSDELSRWFAVSDADSWTVLKDVQEHESLSDRIEAARRQLDDLEAHRAEVVEELAAELRSTLGSHVAAELSRVERSAQHAKSEIERSISRYAVEIAEVILRRELTIEDGIGELAREAIAARATTPTSIRVGDQVTAASGRDGGVALTWDPELGPGDVIVEFESGVLDLRIATLLQLASAALDPLAEKRP